MRILHLTDTHLLAHGGLHQGKVDTAAALHRAICAARRLQHHDLVIISGDVSEDGTVESYALAHEIVDELTRHWGVPTAWTVGNHDRRSAFCEVLGDGITTPPSTSVPAGAAGDDTALGAGAPMTGTGPVDAVSVHDGTRVITVDTSVPGKGYGEVDPVQLDRLGQILSTPARHGTVLAMHHPPVAPVTMLHGALKLRNAPALAEVLAGSDVRVVIGGHYHHLARGTVAGIPVVVGPGIANRTDTGVQLGWERAVRGSGFTSIELGEDVEVTVHEVGGPGDGDEIFAYTPVIVERVARTYGPDGWAPAEPLDWTGPGSDLLVTAPAP